PGFFFLFLNNALPSTCCYISILSNDCHQTLQFPYKLNGTDHSSEMPALIQSRRVNAREGSQH
ncbi:hypothetical protein, partial [Bowmanella dokdonensis]